jgi:hypothetical protein
VTHPEAYVKWLAGWNYNPFIKPEDTKSKTPWIKEEAPDVLGVLSKQRWITPGEAEMHFISSVLGEMEKEGFKFFFPGAPSEWDENYLNSVMAHGLSLKMLRARQRWEAGKSGNKAPAPPPLPPLELQKAIERRKKFHQSFKTGTS